MKTVDKPNALITCMLRVPQTTAQKLDAEAARQGMIRGRSTIIRRAVLEYLDRQERQQKQEAA